MSTQKTYEKLPVFIICGKSPIKSYGGGYSTFALHLAKVLTGLGHQAYILAVGSRNEKIKIDAGTIINCKTTFFDYNVTALPTLPISSYFFAKNIKKIAEEKKMRRFIVWGIGPWGFAGTLLKLKMKDRVIFLNNYFTTLKHEWHGGLEALCISDYGMLVKGKFFLIYLIVVPFLTIFEKQVIKHADFIITNYKSTENILTKQFGTSAKKFVRTTFLVQLYERKANEGKEIKSEKFPKDYILYVSRHDPRKGINFLLHAIKLLTIRGRSYHFIIGGTGQMLNGNKKLAKKLGISKYVSFVGFVNNTRPLLKNAALFCFPTVEEGAGALIINEAMSLGIPIVTTLCDGIPEDIQNNKSGILVPPKNAAELARAIDKLMKNKTLRETLGRNAKKRYEKEYSFLKMNKDIETLVKRVTGNAERLTQS